MSAPLHLSAVRPLVRYVDEEQAVIDTHVSASPAGWWSGQGQLDPVVEVLVEIRGSDGFHDEERTPLRLVQGRGRVRLDVVQPNRWWPAGMGDQPLYDLTVSLVMGDQTIGHKTTTIGLTSVRCDASDSARAVSQLLVNGQVCSIRSLVMVDRVDENQLLPAAGDSILLVRDHYGPDVLYEAADRAGILLIQCVPIDPEGTPEREVTAQVDRLAPHPSLAGWFIGHLGRISDQVAQLIRTLDPTRSIFRELPSVRAA
ncbi:MAG TPA: hypothetical protein VF184_01285 [Phycisphaeraceae bacterium]